MTSQLSDEAASRIPDQIHQIFILPEIERRRAAGEWTDDDRIHAALVILQFGSPPDVRLNGEVSLIAKITPTRPLAYGEPVTIEDIASIEGIELHDNDANAGYVALIRCRDGWHLAFDFRYNRPLATQYMEAAGEFLKGANFARDRGLKHLLVENLFAVFELLGKSMLIQVFEDVYFSRKHSTLKAKLNLWAKLGQVDSRYAKALNELSALRESARYLERDLVLDDDDADRLVQAANDFMNEMRLALKPQTR